MTIRTIPSIGFALLLAATAWAEEIPAKLIPPKDAVRIGSYAAKGVQIYACTTAAAGNEWKFKAPEAELADTSGKVFARHYAGPTWEAVDGSKIVGKVMETAPAPAAGAVPWLLLSAQPSGTGALEGARFVQRIDTAGGVGPTGPCPTAGAEQRIPYSAEYVFYK